MEEGGAGEGGRGYIGKKEGSMGKISGVSVRIVGKAFSVKFDRETSYAS